MITILDYSTGNIGSIQNMLNRLDQPYVLSKDESTLENATKLLLIGVGSFDNGMNNLLKSDYLQTLHKKILTDKTPILGICLGFQLMSKNSSEGKLNGLGWINGSTVKLNNTTPDGKSIKLPHIGWNGVSHSNSKLYDKIPTMSKFYFMHSYHVTVEHSNKNICSYTNYGIDFISSYEYQNIIGVQFHPEKSHSVGQQLLKNFISYY